MNNEEYIRLGLNNKYRGKGITSLDVLFKCKRFLYREITLSELLESESSINFVNHGKHSLADDVMVSMDTEREQLLGVKCSAFGL